MDLHNCWHGKDMENQCWKRRDALQCQHNVYVVLCLDEDQQPVLTDMAQEPTAICNSLSLHQLLEPLVREQRDTADKLATLTSHVQVLDQQIRASLLSSTWRNISERDIAVLIVAMFLQLFFVWLLKWHLGLYLWCGLSDIRKWRWPQQTSSLTLCRLCTAYCRK